jgi:hypothetical protein
LYLSSIDDIDGKTVLENEPEVKRYLQLLLIDPDYYSIKAYERTGVSYQIKRTKLLVHSFYVIIENKNIFHTLSFYGTSMGFYSEGAWRLDGDSDRISYTMYIQGSNEWDVKEIRIENGIAVYETARNIIEKIDSTVRYYYRDHINDKPNADNCNTALYETLVELQAEP